MNPANGKVTSTYTSPRSLLVVVTRSVMVTLAPEDIAAACLDLRRKMQVPDPNNPNLWSTQIGGRKLWGILDSGAGPNGEDLFTILFPEDY